MINIFKEENVYNTVNFNGGLHFGWENIAEGAAAAGSSLINSSMEKVDEKYYVARKTASGTTGNIIKMLFQGAATGEWGVAINQFAIHFEGMVQSECA